MARFSMFVVLAGVALSGCTTAEYDAEFTFCERKWMKRIPPQFEQQMVKKVRYEQVPDGNVTCYSHGRLIQCTEGTKKVAIPYIDFETVDVHEETRDARIESCAASACAKKFGNADCETEE
ncbi:MAG: hypothetical protein ACYYKD_12225 [Rhodospirillales bacterium]